VPESCAAAAGVADGQAKRAPSATELAALRARSERAWAEHRARQPPAAPFTSWVQGTTYDASSCARGAVDTDRRVDFDTDGFLHLRGFAPPDECEAMLRRMHDLVEGWDPVGELVGFNTRAKEQESAQGSSDYFLDSADRIHFFAELDAIDPDTGGLAPGLSKHRALNKVGHALHLQDDVFRAYAQAPRMRELLRELGWRAPVLPQSMYIFKQPLIGGESTSHQDSGFLYTTPRQTCIGIWLALQPATLENGARAAPHASAFCAG
jgi:phytanoyl-CoA hydroxylase